MRVEGKIKDPAQFGRIIVAQQGGGPVYLSQVADVIDGEKEETSIARINGRPSITHRHPKAQDANIVETGRGVRDAVAALKDRLPSDVEVQHRQLDGRAGREERQPRQEHDRRGRAPHGADRVPVPAQLAQHDHHRAHAAARGDRDVHRALRVRLHAQLPDADGAVAVHRPPDRRRDRRAREHRAPPGDGQGPHDGGARGHRRDRPRGDGDHVRDRRGVRADRVHERHHRPLLLPVRRHRRGRGAGDRCSSASRSTRCSRRSGTIRRARASSACRGSAASWTWIERGIEWMHASTAACSTGRSATARACSRSRSRRSSASFALVPLVGTEFMPQADQSFISLRLNTPVGSSLEYTDGKVREVEEALKKFPEIDARDDDRRHRGRPQLRAHQPEARRPRRSAARSQKELESAIRDALQPDPGHRAHDRLRPADLVQPARARSGHAVDDRAASSPARSPRSPASPTSRLRTRPRIPRCRSGSTTTPPPISASPCSRSGATIRPLLAGDTVSYWLGPDGAELRGQRAAAEGQPPARRPTSATSI